MDDKGDGRGNGQDEQQGKAVAGKPKKRRWFQFHLSTALIATLVASGFIWANTFRFHFENYQVTNGSPHYVGWTDLQGIPFPFYRWTLHLKMAHITSLSPKLNILSLSFDVAFAMGIIVLIAILCERTFFKD